MRKFIIISFAALLTIAGCAGKMDEISPSGVEGLTATVSDPVLVDSYSDTKALSGTFKFSFTDSDYITICSPGSGQSYMNYAVTVDPDNQARCEVQVGGFTLEDGTHHAMYPKTEAANPENVSFPLTGQIQTGNNNTDHLAAFDCNLASTEVSAGTGTFAFKHKVAWLKFVLTFEDAENVKSITIKGADQQFANSISVNIPAGTATANFNASEMVLTLKESGHDYISLPANGTVTAYMTLPAEVNLDRFRVLAHTLDNDQYQVSFEPAKVGSRVLHAGKYAKIQHTFPKKVNATSSMQTLFSAGTHTLSADIQNVSGTKSYAEDSNVDLNGHTITLTDGSGSNIMTFTGTSKISNGVIKAKNSTVGQTIVFAGLGSNVTLENVEIQGPGISLWVGGNGNPGTVTIKPGCKFVSTATQPVSTDQRKVADMTPIAVSRGATVNIEGGEFKGYYYALVIATSGGTANISGGEFYSGRYGFSLCNDASYGQGTGYINITAASETLYPIIHGNLSGRINTNESTPGSSSVSGHPSYYNISGGKFDAGCQILKFTNGHITTSNGYSVSETSSGSQIWNLTKN